MKNADKTVTVYHKMWDRWKGVDIYTGTVLEGVSFHASIKTNVSTDGLTHACEATLRIPAGTEPEDFQISTGDLVCEGNLPISGVGPGEIATLCPYVYTAIGVTRNNSVCAPHVKVVCK